MQARKFIKLHQAFTIVELLVVIGIMGLLTAISIPSFIVWREQQDLISAQRELVTNLQKARSHALAGRRMAGQVSKYYVVRLSTQAPTVYTVEGISYNGNSPEGLLHNGDTRPVLENWKLPGRIQISSIAYERPAGTPQTNPSCMLGVFALPYGSTYIDTNNDDGLDGDSSCGFFDNYEDSARLGTYANSKATITLSRPGGGLTKTITINGVTGQIQAD